MHRSYDSQVVHAGGDMRKECAYLNTGVAMRRKFPLRTFQENPLVTGAILNLGMVRFNFFTMIAI